VKEVKPDLLLGSKGMLGRAFIEAFSVSKLPYLALDVEDIDITDAKALKALPFRTYPLIINCAAYTDVDAAEENEALASRVNGEAVGLIAEACKPYGATVVHFSTDYVFDGLATEPYLVDAPRAPVNAYGRSKALGEQLLEQSGVPHLLLRTSWLYAPWGKNFVLTMLKLGHEKEVLRVVDDQRGRPSSSHGVVHTTLRLLSEGARGAFHTTDSGECSWFEFTQAIVELSGGSARVEPCSSAEFPRPAKRPAYSVLDLGPTEACIGPLMNWRDRLSRTLERLRQGTPAA
jgi:dTDP-4-dehydrorhamnose reductase